MKKKDPTSHRIIEKRRRDRMNSCLADLSKLIPQHYLKKSKGRIEKTEIIEMAIRHLKDLTELSNGQQRQISHHQTLLGRGQAALAAASAGGRQQLDATQLATTYGHRVSGTNSKPPSPTSTSGISSSSPSAAAAATGAAIHKHQRMSHHSDTCRASSTSGPCTQQVGAQETTGGGTKSSDSPRRHPAVKFNGFQQCLDAAGLQDCVAHVLAGNQRSVTSNSATALTSTAIRMMQTAHHQHSAHVSGSSSTCSPQSTSKSYHHHHHHHHHYLSATGGHLHAPASTSGTTGTGGGSGSSTSSQGDTNNTGANLHKYRTSQATSSSSSGSDSSSSGGRSSGSWSSGNRSNGNSSSGASDGHRSPGSNSNSAKYSSSGATGGSQPPGSGLNSIIVGGVNAYQQNDNNNGATSSCSSSSSSASLSSMSDMRAAALSSHRTSSGFGSSSSETTNQTSRIKTSPVKMTIGGLTDGQPNITRPIECCSCGKSIITQLTGGQQQPPPPQKASNVMTQAASDNNNHEQRLTGSASTQSDTKSLDCSSSSGGSDNEGAGNYCGTVGDNTGSNSGSASDSVGSESEGSTNKMGSGGNSSSSSSPSSSPSSSSPQSSTSSSSSSAAWFKKAWLVRSFSRSPPNRNPKRAAQEMAVCFTKYQDDITRAWREVVDSTDTQKWALFTYEGATNVIKPIATGQEGLDELCEEFNCSLIQYAFCRVIDESLGLNKLVLINWQGDSAPLSRKGICASHVGDVANYFKGCTQTLTIRNDDEATREHLMEQILKTSASKLGLSKQQQQPSKITSATTTTTTTTNTNNGNTQDVINDSNSVDTSVSSSSISLTSSVYKKVEIGTDIAASRKSFWQRQEEEEKERLAEEKRRAVEKQAQFEKERKQREELEAKKLDATIKERDRLIEATKKADKQSSGVASKSEVSSSTGDSAADDDGRVGRRSELIRLERNQETQSLISKGLIKNKRAIFEQAQQQQQNQQPTTLSRRGSGAMIAKRVNAFKSMDSSSTNISPSSSNSNTNRDGSTSSPAAVHTLTESFNKQISLTGGDESAKAEASVISDSNSPAVSTTTATTAIKKEIEPVQLTPEDDDLASTNTVVAASPRIEPQLEKPTPESPAKVQSNGVKQVSDTPDQDDNGNIDISFSKKSPVVAADSPSMARSATPQDVITNEELIMTGLNSSIKAIALYDYQAADNTEISFDPDDQIGHIQKVDCGWWHGHVISGKFKGQIGLFPANYVQEL